MTNRTRSDDELHSVEVPIFSIIPISPQGSHSTASNRCDLYGFFACNSGCHIHNDLYEGEEVVFLARFVLKP